MTKEPAPGKVKTRLSPPLSPTQAATLYDCFLQDRLVEMNRLLKIDKSIAYAPESAESLFKHYAKDRYAIFPQRGRNLGERMIHIFAGKFKEGYEEVVIIGSDSPDLPVSIVSKGFIALSSEKTDVVIGPARDGGYYLIGLKKDIPQLFTGILWGTDSVLPTTLEKAKILGLNATLLPPWNDIDDYHDLINFYRRYENPIRDKTQIASKTIAFLKEFTTLKSI